MGEKKTSWRGRANGRDRDEEKETRGVFRRGGRRKKIRRCAARKKREWKGSGGMNERELKAAASIPAVAFKNPNPCVKINVNRSLWSLATNRSDNVASSSSSSPSRLCRALKNTRASLCGKWSSYQTRPCGAAAVKRIPDDLQARRAGDAVSASRGETRARCLSGAIKKINSFARSVKIRVKSHLRDC